MAKTDPHTFCAILEWYLTARDADCGVRSTFASQVAAIEGHRGTPGQGERFQHEQVEFRTQQTAFAKDRIMRRRWAALDPYTRDVLAAHYTGSARVRTDNGYSRFPRGFEAHLGKFSGVALYLADLDGSLPALIKACESGKDSLIKPFRARAEEAVRAAHAAYYLIADDDPYESEDQHPLEGMIAHERMSHEQLLQQIDGIWRQIP